MKEKEGLAVFLAFVLLLISGGWTEGWPGDYFALQPYPASLNACPAFPISPTYCSFVSRAEVNSTFEDPCRFTLAQYACSFTDQVSNMTSGELSSILQCSVRNQTAQLDQAAFLLLFDAADVDTLQGALEAVSMQTPSDQISPATKTFLLNAAWEKLKTDPQIQKAGFLASWLQVTMHSYLTSINNDILDCMIRLPISCNGFATVVQALDSVYPRMENHTRKLVANWIAKFLTIRPCGESSAKEWLRTNWKSFLNDVSYDDLTKAWSDFDGFSALDVLTSHQLAQLTTAHGVLSNISLTEPVARVLSVQSVHYMEGYLDELSLLPLETPLERDAMHLMLETLLTKVNESFPDLCSPSLEDLFQVKLTRLLPVIDAEILKLLPTQIGCRDFHNIYKGLNSVYYELDLNVQKDVFKNRLDFLEGQLTKEGVACTFTAPNSQTWLLDNFGFSSSFASYRDFLRLNPSFNGFEVLDVLTPTQIATLVVISGTLTDSTRISAEMEAAKVMETFQRRNVTELQTFLLEVNIAVGQRKIEKITNVKVRDIMLQEIFQILKPLFAFGEIIDIEAWFGGILTMYLPSVTLEELQVLPLVSNCSQVKAIVEGLDEAFEPMTPETKIAVAQWLTRTLQELDCQTTQNWVSVYFLRFKSVLNITDIMAIDPNFNGTAHLEDLSAVQLAQLTVTKEVLTSAEKVEMVLTRLAQLPNLDNLAAYWEAFNVAYEKPSFVLMVNISMEVRGLMLTKTIERLDVEFATFTDADYQLWFEKRLVLALPSVTTAVLKRIPRDISCEAYSSVITGLNSVFFEIPQERKTDVLNYIVSFLTQNSQLTGPACSGQTTSLNWLLKFFGKFSMDMPYGQLVSYYHQPFDAYAVLNLLTPSQIGEMIIHSNTLNDVSLAMRFVHFVEESNVDHVRIILKEFTRAAFQTRLVVLPKVEIAELVLMKYLALASPQMNAYAAADWSATFQGELRYLAFAVNETTLAYLKPQNYESFAAIVAGLSEAHSHMSEPSRRAVVLWIIQNLKMLKGYPMEPGPEWIEISWGSFFQDATLEEVKSTNDNYDPSSTLNVLNVEQLVEFIWMSDALDNVTTMTCVLSSLETRPAEIPLAKMEGFLTAFGLAIDEGYIPDFRNAEVKFQVLSTIFTNLGHHFYKFTPSDYQAWFQMKLKFLLPSITEELLRLIPLKIDFPSYVAIFAGFDQVYAELPQETSLHIYSLMKGILELQINVSGVAFPGAYDDSQHFLQLIFYQFLPFATYSDLVALCKGFNGYEVLAFLSPKQMGQMMVITRAFRDELQAVQILVEMEKRPPAEMEDFMSEFNAAAKQNRLAILPDPRIRDLIFRAVFKTLQFNTFSAEQYSFWFAQQLQLLLSALSPKDLALIPIDLDCQSHQNLVKGMDQAYEHFTAEQREAIHQRIFSYLASYQMDQGITCSPDGNSGLWLRSNYGRFGALANLSELLSVNVNFNPTTAIAELSAPQLAELWWESIAVNDETGIVEIMSHLDSTEELAEFLDKLNAVAGGGLQSIESTGDILTIAFQRIAVDFPRFKPSDFAYWFQVAFQNVLHTVNETLVVDLPLRISCSSYQQILKGFNNIYANIPAENAHSIFGFCRAFLTAKVMSGNACRQPTQDVQEWLEVNLGNFSKYAEYLDLLSWNLNFDGLAVLEYLSAPQLASITLRSGAINEEEKMCQILTRLQSKPLEDIYKYLDQFNLEAQKLEMTSLKEEVVRKKMLSQFLEATAPKFSTFLPGDWTHLLSTRLVLFLPSISKEESQKIFFQVSGCDSFHAVVSALSQVYAAIPLPNQESIYSALFGFLGNQQKTRGSACVSNGEDSATWLQENLGAFASNAPFEDFTKLWLSFNGFDVKDNLTSVQLAHVFFDPGVLDSPDSVGALLMPLENKPINDILDFVKEFSSIASQTGVSFLQNPEVRDVIFKALFSRLQNLFPTASLSQYKDWFQDKLTLWLPSINASALVVVPKTIPCDIFKVIMAGLDGSFPHMSPESRQDVYNFARDYLMMKKSQGGDPCTENTRGSSGWLKANLGAFSSLAHYNDLIAIHRDFSAMDALKDLTLEQLADFSLTSDVLRNDEKAGKVFSSLSSHNIGEFLDAFNVAAQRLHIFQLPHLETRQFILGEIFCHLTSTIKLFTTEDYALWFGRRLRLFSSSLDAQNLGFLPKDLTCDSLAAIVEALDDHYVNNTFENPEEILSFIIRLLHFQVENSGSACTQGISSDRQWLTKFFGPFTAYSFYSDFTALKSNFRGADSLDLFSASALAHFSTHSHTIYNSSAMALVFQVIREKPYAIQFMSPFLSEFNALVQQNPGLLSNTKMRETLLMFPAEMIFPHIAVISLEETTQWFQTLHFLLLGINGTMLDLLPLGMPCPYYQIIVKALDDVYPSLSARKKQEVYEFQKAYLANQFADSGSACNDRTGRIRDWLTKNLGEFCSNAKLSELQAFYPELDGVENLTALSPAQAADLTVVAQMLGNTTLTSMALGLVKDFEDYPSLHDYMARLTGTPCQSPKPTQCDGPSPLGAFIPEMQQELLGNVLFFLKKEGRSMNASQWAEIYHLLLSGFLPTLGTSHLHQTSSNLTCETFYATMKEIAGLHPSLIHQQEELTATQTLCNLDGPQPNPTAMTWVSEGIVTRDIRGSVTDHTSGGTTTSGLGGGNATQTPGGPLVDVTSSHLAHTPTRSSLSTRRSPSCLISGSTTAQTSVEPTSVTHEDVTTPRSPVDVTQVLGNTTNMHMEVDDAHTSGSIPANTPGSTSVDVVGVTTSNISGSHVPNDATANVVGTSMGHSFGSSTSPPTHSSGGTSPGSGRDVTFGDDGLASTHTPQGTTHNISSRTSAGSTTTTASLSGGATTYTTQCPLLVVFCILLAKFL